MLASATCATAGAKLFGSCAACGALGAGGCERKTKANSHRGRCEGGDLSRTQIEKRTMQPERQNRFRSMRNLVKRAALTAPHPRHFKSAMNKCRVAAGVNVFEGLV